MIATGGGGLMGNFPGDILQPINTRKNEKRKEKKKIHVCVKFMDLIKLPLCNFAIICNLQV